jgi:hypothetical protein
MMLDITTTLESNQAQAKKQEAQQNTNQSIGDKVVEKVGEMIFKRLILAIWNTHCFKE